MKIDLGKRLTSILKRVEQTAINKYLERYYSRLKQQVAEWKVQVKFLLSVPYNRRHPNNSMYPKLRSGRLRNSLHYRTGRVKYNAATKTAIASIAVTWNNPNPNGEDYGEILNSSTAYADRKFFGWKDRTYDLLMKRLRSLG